MPSRIGPQLTEVGELCPIHRPDGQGSPARSFCCGEPLAPQAVFGADFQAWFCTGCGWTQEPPYKMLTGKMPRGKG